MKKFLSANMSNLRLEIRSTTPPDKQMAHLFLTSEELNFGLRIHSQNLRNNIS